MGCNDYWEMISEELDGELEEDKSLFLMRHLVICDGCFQEYQDAYQVRCMLKQSSHEYPGFVPKGFSARVMEMIENEESARVPSQAVSEPVYFDPPKKPLSMFSIAYMFRFLSKPAIQLSFALSIVLIISLSIFYNRSDTDISSNPSLLDAKRLKPESMEQQIAGKNEDEEDLNYYVKRHAAAVGSSPASMTMPRRGGNLSYVTYSRVK